MSHWRSLDVQKLLTSANSHNIHSDSFLTAACFFLGYKNKQICNTVLNSG